MFVTDCRFFSGYKPCGRNSTCDSSCPQKSIPTLHILFLHLGALGAVVRSTAHLPALRRKYPGCHITWLTQAPADQFLQGHPLIDRVLTLSESDLLKLSTLEFDLAFCIDKSLIAQGLLKKTTVDQIYGFRSESRSGAIVPATPDDSTWVVETGRPKISAAPIVPAATSSAEAP